MRGAKRIWLAMGAMAAWLAASEVALAYCAMCRTALLSSPEGQKLADGFNTGILFLLSAPFAVVGVTAFLIFKARLSNRAGAAVRDSASLPPCPSTLPPGLPEGRSYENQLAGSAPLQRS